MRHGSNGLIVGIDVGGTFTDLVQLDQENGHVQLAKVPTTPENQAFGVLVALEKAECNLAALDLIVHGTTTTTNAVLERKLSRTGLITTRGFRDILELGRRTRPQAYGMTGQFTPLIPRDLRLEVPERVDAAGDVLVPLDEPAVRIAGQTLLDMGCESVVIHFLHAYANPEHEQRTQAILSEFWPNPHITMGHAILQECREFERGVTAAVNASVQPILDRYLKRLTKDVADAGYKGDILVMNGNGGMASAQSVAREAAKTVMSGPASGVMAAAYTARASGLEDLITYDMGGTSTDVALVRGADPAVSNETEIEYAMPIHVPMVDVRTVGAGGGSIARVNAAGLLEIGPDSAGADPGPICYGRGGQAPTISDANLILGRLDAEKVVHSGGLGSDKVARIFAAKLAEPLNLDVTHAAQAVVHMANTKMAGAIRMVSLSLGADPRDFTLFAFGGAGPLHACALAKELGVPRVMVPARPGITNAIGCVTADLRHDFVRTINQPLDALQDGALEAQFHAQARQGSALIEKERLPIETTRFVYSADMQFVGQTHLLRVPIDSPDIRHSVLKARFEAVYADRFRVDLVDLPAQVVNVNCSVIGERPPLDLSILIDPKSRATTLEAAKTGHRRVYFDGEWHDTPVFWRDKLPLEFSCGGPVIIEQMDTTVLIPPRDRATGDPMGNIIVEIGAGYDH